MSFASRIKRLHLAYLSKPACDRPLYRTIQRAGIRKIVEIGLGDGLRATRLIQAASYHEGPVDSVSYTGIDLFEARQEGFDRLTLKEAHRQLTATGARVKLVPGDPLDGLARAANMLAGTDFVVLGAEVSAEAMAFAWFYVPRLLHERSLVVWEQPASQAGQPSSYRPVSHEEINRLASTATRRNAA